MNTSSSIFTCPECGADVPLSETIAAPLIEKLKKEANLKVEQALERKKEAESELAKGQEDLALARAQLEAEVSKRLSGKLAEQEKIQRETIRAELEAELTGAQDRESEAKSLLRRAQLETQEALKAKQKAELEASGAVLDAQKRVQAEISEIKAKAQQEAQDRERLKVAEKDKQIEKLLSQLDEAKRQAQQGSQQLQGEILELDLEVSLRQAFPWDEIDQVKTGQRGGDLIHKVMSGPGQHAGTLMWEIKRTQAWGGDWTSKAKQDALSAKCEIVVIVSEATPKGIDSFGFFEGVWVCRPAYATALAHAMRQQMDIVATTRRASIGKQGKAEMLYDYLVGPEFKARLEGIVEPFIQMQSDLASEKRATLARWKKRDKQIERVLLSASSLSGDLQGIGGRDMPELPAFTEEISEELELLEEGQ